MGLSLDISSLLSSCRDSTTIWSSTIRYLSIDYFLDYDYEQVFSFLNKAYAAIEPPPKSAKNNKLIFILLLLFLNIKR